jgi:serine/threonine protein kinase
MKIQNQIPLSFNYSTSEMIGKGFTSQVYKGVSKITGFPLAVKIIDRNAMKEEDRRLINSEIASMRKLRGKSPYILNLIEVNEVGPTVFIVTEQCDCDLGKILQETRLR